MIIRDAFLFVFDGKDSIEGWEKTKSFHESISKSCGGISQVYLNFLSTYETRSQLWIEVARGFYDVVSKYISNGKLKNNYIMNL